LQKRTGSLSFGGLHGRLQRFFGIEQQFMHQRVPAFGFAEQHPFHAADGLAAQTGHPLGQAEELLPVQLEGLLIMVGDCPTIIRQFKENDEVMH